MDKRIFAFVTAAAGLVLLAGPVAATAPEHMQKETSCSVDSMVDNLRESLQSGSPSLKRYASTVLREAALTLSAEDLRAAFARERQPAMVEALAAALATKASHSEDPSLIRPLLSRATHDADPAVRAAALRGLRSTGSVDMMAKSGERVRYEQLIQDASPEVRKAVVENLKAESSEVYAGHDRTVSETAISAAKASTDPAATAELLRNASMEQVGSRAVRDVTGQLESSNPQVRAAAASALGGVQAAHSSEARVALTQLYRNDATPEVRRAVLESIARLGQTHAIPALESLASIDPAMKGEIDAWIAALKLGLQEWNLISREKERRETR
ncbi:HEAT repeat domain-containing protein [Pendulispora brunnea]|uniref:HEAT repeat domain-containing protein n=1 Tax=Pendulispora brunnea TaxID=2905690 RepID=A0ABZ2K2W8_9BACT